MACAGRVRTGVARFSSSAGATFPTMGSVGPRPGDLIPGLAALIPQTLENRSTSASQLPWVKSSRNFFDIWEKVAPCMPNYADFIAQHKSMALNVRGDDFVHDANKTSRAMQGRAMASEEILAALGKFYLHVALQLRPREVETAGSDSAALMKVAQACAEEEFEPFVENARNLVSDYDPKLHRALEETSSWYEVDGDEDRGLFWQANFDIVAPTAFQHFLTAVGHGSGQNVVPSGHTSRKQVSHTIQEIQTSLNNGSAAFEPARRAAEVVYSQWLEASSMPVKGDIKTILMEHGLIVSQDVFDNKKLMPRPLVV